MQAYKPLFAGLSLMCAAFLVHAQGNFRNLNFESAQIPPSTRPGSNVSTNAGIPGWTAYYYQPVYGGGPSPVVVYDGIPMDGAMIAINDANAGWDPIFGSNFAPLQGTFSANLFGGAFQESVTISQTGLVPSGTRSLQAMMQWGRAAPVVTLGDQTINMVALQTFPNYTLYGGDISAFAGQVAALSFTEPPPPNNGPSELILDNIVFSTQGVPEPNIIALSALGALLVGWRGLPRHRVRNSAVCSTCGRAADHIYGWKLCTVTAKSSYLSAASKVATIGRWSEPTPQLGRVNT